MGAKPAKVTDAELAVMNALWEGGPATVRQVRDVVYPGSAATEYGTVHKLLERLEGKRCVRRERRGREFLFHATVGRDELIGRELESVVDKLCGGSLQPLLTHLVRAKGLTPQELRDLLALVEELREDRPPHATLPP